MYRVNNKVCVDCGSKYCPCHLAYTGDCIKCSLIRGEKTCDCLWQGICVYNEVKHSNEKLVNERKEYYCNILEKNEIEESLFLVKIKIPNNLVKDLSNPGAYVLLKSKNRESEIFNTPISVMDVDLEKSILEVVIKLVGIKTKTLLDFDEIIVKGPYFNGIFGIDKICKLRNSNCLVGLSGLSQVNSINVVRKLLENKNTVEVFINRNSIILKEVTDKLNSLGVNVNIIDVKEDKKFILDYIKRNNVSLVYSGGYNNFNRYMKELVDSINKDILLTISNNNLICCGEGICGACTVNLNGERVKSCKTQIDSRNLLDTF